MSDTGISQLYDPQQFAVASLLPQSGRMMLIDQVLAINDTAISTQIVVSDDPLFALADKTVPAWIGIEYMAQTIAAFSGYHCRLLGEPIRLGFLLGTRHYETQLSAFSCGSLLTVNAVKIIESANEMCVFTCEMFAHQAPDTMIASAKINLLLPKDLAGFLARSQAQ